jgi:hypothetical protein
MSYFLNESFLVRGDEYYLAICNKTGAIAIYNEEKNLFLSPYADGPINFITNPDGSQNIKNLSKFGRSFSIVKIPYSLKLLMQELQVMNVQMRIITDENVDQLLSLSYSDNLPTLMKEKDLDLNKSVDNYVKNVNKLINSGKVIQEIREGAIELPEKVNLEGEQSSPEYVPGSETPLDEPLRVTEEQKQYKLAEGEESDMPEITQADIDDPTRFLYIRETRPDGSINIRNRYTYPFDVITMLSKDDQRFIIQQPFKIQYKILGELAEEHYEKVLEQKRLFDEGKAKTPFYKRMDANEDSSIPYAEGSPAYDPSLHANVPSSSQSSSQGSSQGSSQNSPTFITTKTTIKHNEPETVIVPPAILEVESNEPSGAEKSNNKTESDVSEAKKSVDFSENSSSSSSSSDSTNETRKITI